MYRVAESKKNTQKQRKNVDFIQPQYIKQNFFFFIEVNLKSYFILEFFIKTIYKDFCFYYPYININTKKAYLQTVTNFYFESFISNFLMDINPVTSKSFDLLGVSQEKVSVFSPWSFQSLSDNALGCSKGHGMEGGENDKRSFISKFKFSTINKKDIILFLQFCYLMRLRSGSIIDVLNRQEEQPQPWNPKIKSQVKSKLSEKVQVLNLQHFIYQDRKYLKNLFQSYFKKDFSDKELDYMNKANVFVLPSKFMVPFYLRILELQFEVQPVSSPATRKGYK